RLADQTMSPEHLSAVWIGSASDPFAEEIIIGTAGAALFALHAAPEIDDCDRLARELWGARLKRLAA
ncbi:MAG: glycosyl transferase family 3, partial [Pseudomonadota bacterium]